MTSVASAAAQQKFTGLRKRLDQLGYRQALGIESLPLVEKLFSDLVHTTESLKKAKAQVGHGQKEKSNFEAQIEPYKSDNAKLVKENNDLHQQLIRTREETEVTIKELKASLRKLEHENADIRFLNNQYVHKVRALEQESKTKTDKILQLQEKNFHAVVQTPGGRKKNIPFRRQRMDIDAPGPPAEISRPLNINAEDPYTSDLLKVADERIAELSKQNENYKLDIDGAQEKIKLLKKQVETRDGEIDRLGRLLEGGRPYDVVALETRNRSNERLISHLNIQIDYLQQRNQDLQRELDFSNSKARTTVDATIDLDNRNMELERELQDVDRIARLLQLDKDTAIRVADREINEAKLELSKSRSELETLDLEVAHLRAEKEQVEAELNALQSQMTSEKSDKKRLEDLIDKIQEDKRRLGNRVNKLTANERELVLDIDRLKHKNGPGRKRGKSPDRLQAFLKGVEEERDYWRSETEVLQKLLKATKSSSPVRKSRSPVRSPTRSPTRSLNNTPVKNKSRSSSLRNSKEDKSEKSAAHYDTIIRVLEEERDHYKRECEILQALKHRSTSPSRLRDTGTEAELMRVQHERDELQSLLDKFERHMAEIQANVKVLTCERDKLSSMYEETQSELDRVRRDVIRSPKSAKISLAAQAVLRRVENERDDAISQYRQMTTERDTLRERLKIATEGHLADRARLEQKAEDAERACHLSEKERNEFDAKVKSLSRANESLEDRIRQHVLNLSATNEESAAQKATATQMRLLAEQAERSLEDQQRKLAGREAELRRLEDKLAAMDGRVSELTHTGRMDSDEISNLHATISSLDREKDSLQNLVDEKTEQIVQLEHDLLTKEKFISELKLNVQEMEITLDRANDDTVSKDCELQSLRRQLDSATAEVTEIRRGREVALRENRRLQEDLATMTRENQNLNIYLDEAREERETLKDQVQEYLTEVKRIEELLNAKENERTNLLDQYRSLSLEAERFETQTHQLESEGSNMRLEIMTRDSELRRLSDRVTVLEREVQEHVHAQHAYELQVSNLTKSVATLEDALRVVEGEKDNLLQDLAAVRDLCTKLEITKDSLQRQLTNKSLDHEKLATLLDDMKGETELLRQQVSSERTSVKNLEGLLINNREKEFHAHLSSQEQSAELQLLRDRLTLQETKVTGQTRELGGLRSQNLELESELQRLRRQLTSERFERERAVQELRRHGLAPPVETGRLSHASPSRSMSPSSRLRSPDRSRSKSPSPRRQDATASSLRNNRYGSRSVEAWLASVDGASSSSSSSLPSSRSIGSSSRVPDPPSYRSATSFSAGKINFTKSSNCDEKVQHIFKPLTPS